MRKMRKKKYVLVKATQVVNASSSINLAEWPLSTQNM